jgi:hypothetical protein
VIGVDSNMCKNIFITNTAISPANIREDLLYVCNNNERNIRINNEK